VTPPTDTHTAPKTPAQQGRPVHANDESAIFLERGQLVRDRSIPVPPAPLSRRTRIALWLLRIFALTVSFMVIYAFVSQLH
jgi:hypothetical protein